MPKGNGQQCCLWQATPRACPVCRATGCTPAGDCPSENPVMHQGTSTPPRLQDHEPREMLLRHPTCYTSETRASMMLRKGIKEMGSSKGKEREEEGKAPATSNTVSHWEGGGRKCWCCWWRCSPVGHENSCLAWGTGLAG